MDQCLGDMAMDEITIVLATDDNYAQHTAVAAVSMLINHKDDRPLHFYILDDGISEIKESAIAASITAKKGIVTFLPVKQMEVAAYTSGHVHRAAYLRLLIPTLLPDSVHKALYFDTDLVVNDDVKELWDYPLENHPIGAVRDFGIMASARMRRQKEETIGLKTGMPYFNSGVLVMDLDAWRKKDYTRQVLDCVTQNNYRHHDQDGLNQVFMGCWASLPLRWNMIPPVFGMPLKVLKDAAMRIDAIEALKHPAVIHWAGRYKPWEFRRSEQFNKSYYQYLAETAFKNAPMPQPGDMKGKSLFRQELRLKLAKFWQKVYDKK
jgi:lipopolysaccharide biosynthesis glycosyltransferase